jgi:hypothetical protein
MRSQDTVQLGTVTIERSRTVYCRAVLAEEAAYYLSGSGSRCKNILPALTSSRDFGTIAENFDNVTLFQDLCRNVE